MSIVEFLPHINSKKVGLRLLPRMQKEFPSHLLQRSSSNKDVHRARSLAPEQTSIRLPTLRSKMCDFSFSPYTQLQSSQIEEGCCRQFYWFNGRLQQGNYGYACALFWKTGQYRNTGEFNGAPKEKNNQCWVSDYFCKLGSDCLRGARLRMQL